MGAGGPQEEPPRNYYLVRIHIESFTLYLPTTPGIHPPAGHGNQQGHTNKDCLNDQGEVGAETMDS